MRSHEWTIEEVDADAIGPTDFWKCGKCGAGGGPVSWSTEKDRPTRTPFIPGISSSNYSREQMEDCDFTSILSTMKE